MKKLVILLIRLYQSTLGYFFTGSCRFYPTCSTYGIEAIEKHGVGKGLWLIVKRIGKCHPWHPGGKDFVP